jgi:hypothetical protein
MRCKRLQVVKALTGIRQMYEDVSMTTPAHDAPESISDVLADLGEPPAWEVAPFTDDDLVLGLVGPAVASDLMLLESIDPASLTTPRAKITYVKAVDRAVAFATSLRHRAEVALVGERAGTEFLPEVHKAHELSVARRTSRHAASQEITVARRLATSFTGFAQALHAGEVSEAHCATLVSRTRHVSDPEVLARIEARVLPYARRLPVSRFGGEVAAEVSALDEDAPARVRRARATRGVHARQLEDGMGQLTVTHEWSTIRALASVNDDDARVLQLERGGAEEVVAGDADASLDACRADAWAARLLGTVNDDGSVTWDRQNVQVVVNVVMDLDTWRGEADRVALVDDQPVPAEIAREAAEAATWWRRLVTDPVEGHLLDYGRATYLPARLRTFVLARDGGCRTPMCTTAASKRLQMDHAIEFPDGPSDSHNCGGLCPTDHQLKTHGYADITESRSDGSCTWTTLWGQVVHVPPRPVLPLDPDPPPRR